MEKTLAQATDYRNYKSLPNLTKLRIILNVDVSDTKSYHAILYYIRRTYEQRCDRPPWLPMPPWTWTVLWYFNTYLSAIEIIVILL